MWYRHCWAGGEGVGDFLESISVLSLRSQAKSVNVGEGLLRLEEGTEEINLDKKLYKACKHPRN